jgi:hypothetical protein
MANLLNSHAHIRWATEKNTNAGWNTPCADEAMTILPQYLGNAIGYLTARRNRTINIAESITIALLAKPFGPVLPESEGRGAASNGLPN